MILNNSILSMISALIAGLIFILVVPLYINYLDYESYALIGFSIIILSFSQIFDFGFNQILLRKTALFSAGKYTNLDLRILLKSIEIGLLIFFTFCSFLLLIYSEVLFLKLFNPDYLSSKKGGLAIILITFMMFLKSFHGLYKGGIQAFERFQWIAITSVIINILRYPGGLILIIFKPDINLFFIFQLLISFSELIIFRLKYLKIFNVNINQKINFSYKYLASEINFSKSLTFLGVLWVASMHLDKFIIIKAITMEEFGFFTTIMIFSTGLITMMVPFGSVVVARLTNMNLNNNFKEIEKTYADLTQLAFLIFFPVVVTIVIYSWEFIFLLTTNHEIANWGQLILSLFMVGNFLHIMSSFQYFLQLSHGDLNLHTKFSSISLLIYFPVLYYLTNKYGVSGAALSWISYKLFIFFIWTPIVHKKLLPGMHWRWLKNNIITLFFVGMIPSLFFTYNYPVIDDDKKIVFLISIFIVWLLTFLPIFMFSSFFRKIFFNKSL
jgi:O-antigen/teichoic acid export membrane protein